MKIARLLMPQPNQPAPSTPAYAQPYTGLRNSPMTLPPFEQPGGSLPIEQYFGRPQMDAQPQQPGLRNSPMTLPPFERPGGSLPIEQYFGRPQMDAQPQQPVASAPAAPANPQRPVMPQASPLPDQASPVVPPMPAPIAVSDGSVRGDLNAAIRQLVQQGRLLPEQWKGAFANQYGEPA